MDATSTRWRALATMDAVVTTLRELPVQDSVVRELVTRIEAERGWLLTEIAEQTGTLRRPPGWLRKSAEADELSAAERPLQ